MEPCPPFPPGHLHVHQPVQPPPESLANCYRPALHRGLRRILRRPAQGGHGNPCQVARRTCALQLPLQRTTITHPVFRPLAWWLVSIVPSQVFGYCTGAASRWRTSHRVGFSQWWEPIQRRRTGHRADRLSFQLFAGCLRSPGLRLRAHWSVRVSRLVRTSSSDASHGALVSRHQHPQ